MKKILVPVDFSQHSEYALEVASKIAKQHGAGIVLLHMIGISDSVLANSETAEEAEAKYYLNLAKDKIKQYLPALIRSVESNGADVVWSCDPMHGNTYVSESDYKTRKFLDILEEIRNFFDIHHAEGTIPGGVHLELTGKDVTECIGGAQDIMDHQLKMNYSTSCDPRLNAQQSLELAFLISDLLKG